MLIGEKFCIYRVPLHIRKNNENYYEPRLVSIGPYHRGMEHLRAMQEHKRRYLLDYIKRGKRKEEEYYIRQIKEMQTSIRDCYFESFELEEEQFLETMLLDSCFIIQLFTKWYFNYPDPVHNIGWALPLLLADLTMIENQIPFFVLEKIYNIFLHGTVNRPDNLRDNRPCLTQLLVDCLCKMHNLKKESNQKLPICADIRHLLHLYYRLFVPEPESFTNAVSNLPTNSSPSVLLQVCNPTGVCGSEGKTEEERSPRMIPSAKELKEFGVTFKKKKKFKSILDISFEKGVLEIPYIVLEESTRSIYLNLIAFEQCISKDQKHLTSYAVFMDCLINTSEDVIALQRCGIIENKLADTTEAAKFFKQLRDCAHMDYEKHYLKQVFVDITEHRQAFWPKHRARLCRDYFSSPWSIFSLGAALLLLGIAIFKTIYFIVTTF